MVQKNITVINPSGLHLRPAAVLAKVAAKCSSSISIIYGDKRVNCKSSLGIIAAGIKKGSDIIVECNGENEQEDMEVVTASIESGLEELN